jgi:iron(II)-dependent oxidoreductase
MKKTIAIALLAAALAAAFSACSRKWNNPLDPDNNVGPNALQSPSPADNASGVAVPAPLSWSGGDPNSNDTLVYDIYLGEANPPSAKVASVSAASYAAGGLFHLNKYYWKVISHDSHGLTIEGPVWAFTTGPGTVAPALQMVSVPGDSVVMGSGPADSALWQRPDECPQHTVRLGAFAISRHEVTVMQFYSFIRDSGYTRDTFWTSEGWDWRSSNNISAPLNWSSYDLTNATVRTLPVTGVSWHEAYAFTKWAGLRLPTEAEWERAARGNGGARTWPWGDAWNSALANSVHPDSFAFQSPVGSYPGGRSPAPDSILDLAGNAYEWCNDWYDYSYYGSQSTWLNPLGPALGTYKVLRGGSWNSDSAACRTAARFSNLPGTRGPDYGFRVAR